MNYEELYAQLSELEKGLKDSVNTVTRLQKTIVKDTESGDLTDMKKSLAQLEEAVELLKTRTASIQSTANAFDTKEYFVSGDFTRQLLSACREKKVDVKGEKGVYEMFPYKLRILGDSEHAEEVWLNRKKLNSFRPSAVAETVRAGQEKLNKAAFNDKAFLSELAEAYEISCLRSGALIGSSASLSKLYKFLTPMARARKDYDSQAFAFDLARLYEKGPEAWTDQKTGKVYTFGTSRDGKTGIRVLSSSGVESYIATFRQLSAGE